MKAAVLYEKRQPLRVEEVDLNSPRQREVLVKMAASGLCHSDLHYIKGDREHPMPVVLGHEGSGTVAEVGPEVIGGGSSINRLAMQRGLPEILTPGPLSATMNGHMSRYCLKSHEASRE